MASRMRTIRFVLCTLVVSLAGAPMQAQQPAPAGVGPDSLVARADSLFNARRYKGALDAYSLVPPASVTRPVRTRVATLLGFTGRFAAAAAAWRALMAEQPLDDDARTGLAAVLAWMGDPERALAEYDTVLGHAPERLDIRLERVRLFARLGTSEPVHVECTALVADYTAAVETTCAAAFLSLGDIADAQRRYEDARLRWPRDRDAALGSAAVRARAQLHEAAIAIYAGWLASHPDDDEATMEMARTHSWAGNDSTARAIYAGLMTHPSARGMAARALAEVEARAGAFERALALLANSDGEDALNMLMARARVHTLAGRFAPALALYGQVLATDSTRREALLGRADVLVRSGEHKRAIDSFAEWRRTHAWDAEAQVMHARAWAISGNPRAALIIFDSLLQRNPDQREAALGRAAALRASGDAAGAVTAFGALLAAVPTDEEARLGLALTLSETSRAAEALPLFDALIASGHTVRTATVARGTTLARLGQREAARGVLSQWVDAHPDDIDALTALARVELSLRNDAGASAIFARVLAVDPTNRGATLGRVETLLRAGNSAEALVLLGQWLARQPDDPAALSQRGLVMLRTGRVAEGLSDYAAALRVEPEYRDAVLGHASALARTPRKDPGNMTARRKGYEQSLAEYHRWLDQHPDDLEAQLGAATVEAWSGALATAEGELRPLLGTAVGSEAAKVLARVLAWRGALSMSEAQWRALEAQSPKDPEVLAGFGQVLRWEDRPAAAEPYLKRALQSHDASPDLADQIERVRAELALSVAVRTTAGSDNESNRYSGTVLRAGKRAPWTGRMEARAGWRTNEGLSGTATSRTAGLSATWTPVRAPLFVRADAGWMRAAFDTAPAATPAMEASRTTFSYAGRVVVTPTDRLRMGVSVARSALEESAGMLRRGVVQQSVGGDALLSATSGLAVTGSFQRLHVTSTTDAVNGSELSAGVRYIRYRRVQGGVDWHSLAYDHPLAGGGFFAPQRFSMVQGSVTLALGDAIGWQLATDVAGGVQRLSPFDGSARTQGYLRGAVTVVQRWAPGREVGVAWRASNSSASPQAGVTQGYRGSSVELFGALPMARRR
jgi:tetratricopeptide (TPR) repeat protein